MKSFFIRWRKPRQSGEYELFADEIMGAFLATALEESGGMALWKAGTLWECPGCGDRTLRTEEFLEGLRCAEAYVRADRERRAYEGVPSRPGCDRALEWLNRAAVAMLGCERDRVYIKEEGVACRYAGESFLSRI